MDKIKLGNCIYVGRGVNSWWIAEYPNNNPLSDEVRILRRAPSSLRHGFNRGFINFFKKHAPFIIWEDIRGRRSYGMGLKIKADTSALSFWDSLLFRLS